MIQRYIFSLLALFLPFIFVSQTNSLVIFSSSGNPFDLYINSIKINSAPQSNIKAFDVPYGWNKLKIIQLINTKEQIYTDSILLSDKSKYLGKELTYVLNETNEKLSLKFISVSDTSGPSVPPVPEAPKKVVSVIDNNTYGNLYKANDNKPSFFNHYNKGNFSCDIVLDNKDISYALSLFKKCNDEETKLRYLKQIIDFNCYNTNQLKLLLEDLPIEMDRLEVSKQAYSHITDKENVNLLLSVFKYATVKNSYTDFLKEENNQIKQLQLQCKEPITEKKFDELLSNIKRGNYETDKLKIAKTLLINNCVSSAQTKKIAELFTHDREKLELLQSAYPVLTDKENAKDLANEFQFAETKAEFLKYITK